MTAPDNPTVGMAIACNGDHGEFAGQAEMISLPGRTEDGLAQSDALTLSVRRWTPKLVELGGAIRLAGRRFTCVGSTGWFGNMAWNRYELPLGEALALLAFVHGRGLYDAEGWCDVCEVWDAPEPLDLAALRRALGLAPARRVQLSRAKGARMPAGTVKVDRSTQWGNSHVVGAGCERLTPEEAVGRFREEVANWGGMMLRGASRFAGMPLSSLADIRRELAGRDLACWCALDAPCHADVLLELANGVRGGEGRP